MVIKVIRGNAKVYKYKLSFFVQNNPTFNNLKKMLLMGKITNFDKY